MTKNSSTKRNALKFVIAAALTGVVGLANQAQAQQWPEKIRFGDVGFGFGQPFGRGLVAIADAKGFIADEFKDTPVKLEFSYFVNTGPAINEAIANQRLEFASYGAVPNTIGKANGLPTRIILSYGGTTIFGGARADQPIVSVKDLKGRKIAVQKATIIHWSLITTLRQNGLSERDVTLVDLKNADQLAAINAKSVDAIFGGSFFLPLRDQGVVKLISNSITAGGKATGIGAVVVTEAFQQQYPEATLRVTRGLLRAAHWLGLEANREEAFGIWTKTGVTLPILREEFDGVALKEAFNPIPDAFYTAKYRDVIAFNKEQKLIRNDVDFAKWLEPKYYEAALKALDLQTFWTRRNADGAPANATN